MSEHYFVYLKDLGAFFFGHKDPFATNSNVQAGGDRLFEQHSVSETFHPFNIFPSWPG